MTTLPPVDHDAAAPADLQAQAWNWLRLFASGDAREVDARRFRRWVRSSPAHRAAYTEVKRRWDTIEQPARELVRLKPQALAVPEQRRPVGAAFGRRAFLGAAVGAAAVAGIAVVRSPRDAWPIPAEWGADDRTAAGEQRTLALSGGGDVVLNTRTAIRRHLDGGEMVALDLLAGEAAVDLTRATGAFAVAAGAGRSVADTGQFEVRHLDGGRVCVTCIEGTVRVEHPAGTRPLQARQQIVYDARSLGGVSVIDPETVSAWRRGLLVFEQIRLEDALDEINRYRTGRVVLMNDAARNERVSGRFAIASLDLALWQLQEAFGLKARSLPAGWLILS